MPEPIPSKEELDRMVEADPELRKIRDGQPAGIITARVRAASPIRRRNEAEEQRAKEQEAAEYRERLESDPEFREQEEEKRKQARLARRKMLEYECCGFGFPLRLVEDAEWDQVPAVVAAQLKGVLGKGLPPILVVTGDIGQGKSFAAALFGMDLVWRARNRHETARVIPAMWIDWGTLCLAPLGSEREEWYAAEVLIIDGFADGARPNDKGVERAEYLMRHRYDRRLCTVFTTNRSSKDFAEQLGGGFCSVMLAKGNVLLAFPPNPDRRTEGRVTRRAGGA